MKKILQKNQIIITALAIMIAVAGYLNYTGKDIEQYGLNGKDDTKEVSSDNVVQEDSEKEADKKKTDKKDSKVKEVTDISAEDEGEDYVQVSDNGEVVAENQKEGSKEKTDTASKDDAGAAVMVSASLGSDYFSSAKIAREQTRAKNKEILMSIVEDEKLSESQKEEALNRIIALTNAAEQENAAEMVLASKGFENSVVSIVDGSADVIVSADSLTEQQLAQIEDVVKRKTKISAENIVITPAGVKE